MVKSFNINEVAKKLKELKEAVSVCSKVEDQITWAMDFTSFTGISNNLEPVCDAVEEARDQFNREIDYIEDQLRGYREKLNIFKSENKINLNYQ